MDCNNLSFRGLGFGGFFLNDYFQNLIPRMLAWKMLNIKELKFLFLD